MSAPGVSGLVVGVLGGTGPQGRGLARRFAAAGLHVVLGSRSAQRARDSADELVAELAQNRALHPAAAEPEPSLVSAADNAGCARAADLVVIAVPWEGHAELLAALADDLAGKVVVDCVNPIGFDGQGAFATPVPEGSAAQQAARLLPESRVVGAFHHVSAVLLNDPQWVAVETDVLVVGDDRESTDLVQELAALIPGMRGIYAGRLRNAHQVEALTANLVSVNRRYRAHAGLRVTDV